MRALLADYGGVMTLSLREGMADAVRRFGADPARFGEILRSRPGNPMVAVETGAMDWATFGLVLEEAITGAGGSDVDVDVFEKHLMASCPADPVTCAAVGKLKAAGVARAMVSNSWSVTHYSPDITGLFDIVLYSSTFGGRKPDAEIYLAAMEQLGVEPADCVMVDDFVENVEAADRLGMTGILHTDSEQTVARLEELFGVPLR